MAAKRCERGGKKKGQMVFEFIVAAILFISIVVFVLNILNVNVSIFSGGYYVYALENKVLAASEALVKTSGGVGFADEWPVLDGGKIDSFVSNCTSGYASVLSRLSLVDNPAFGRPYRLRVEIDKDGWGAPKVCEQYVDGVKPGNVTSAHVRRFGVVEGEIVSVDVWVW